MVKFTGEVVCEQKTLRIGHHFVEVGLKDAVVFVRKGCLLPLAAAGKNVEDTDWGKLELVHFGVPGDTYELYEDDGFSREMCLEGHVRKINL